MFETEFFLVYFISCVCHFPYLSQTNVFYAFLAIIQLLRRIPNHITNIECYVISALEDFQVIVEKTLKVLLRIVGSHALV